VHRTVVQAREEGHLAADMDAEQMVFELHGLILALQYEARFLRSSKSLARTLRGFENILQRYGPNDAVPVIQPGAKRTSSTKK
jgi:Ni,Fe-hydrogenase I large subunit